MIFLKCSVTEHLSDSSCCVPELALYGVAAAVFLMLLTILILSICLCRACKRAKKQKLTEQVMAADNPEDNPDLHYAELQNLPISNRGQCDGETCTAPLKAQNSDYATVAELKELEDGCCNQQQQGDDVAEDVVKSLVEAE